MNHIKVTVTVDMPNGDMCKITRLLEMPESRVGEAVAELVAIAAEEIPDQRIFDDA